MQTLEQRYQVYRLEPITYSTAVHNRQVNVLDLRFDLKAGNELVYETLPGD